MSIIDCNFATLEDALRGSEAPPETRSTLVLRNVEYVSFDGEQHRGQIVVHRALGDEVVYIFDELLRMSFPILQVMPVVAFGWSDEASMLANNSSAFNYRHIIGTDRLSLHSYGTAIDLNPMQNPYHARDGKVHPEGATYRPSVRGTLTREGEAVQLFKKLGWTWGGDWTVPIDYQHLQKEVG